MKYCRPQDESQTVQYSMVLIFVLFKIVLYDLLFRTTRIASPYYHSPTKLGEGNVFTGVCHSVWGLVSQVPCPGGWSPATDI